MSAPNHSDDTRCDVLQAVARGMTFDYAARAAGISINEAVDIAKAAGYPAAAPVCAAWIELLIALGRPKPVSAAAAHQPAAVAERTLPPGGRPAVAGPVRPAPDARVAAAAEDSPSPTPPPGEEQTPALASPAVGRPYRPRQLPCLDCGVPVLASYVAATGQQRHGHHAAPASDTTVQHPDRSASTGRPTTADSGGYA